MEKKRKSESPSAEQFVPNKRRRDDGSVGPRALPSAVSDSFDTRRNQPYHSDTTYGQVAFPGLNGDLGEDETHESTYDALEYLRAVRAEAQSIPDVFTAPPTSKADDRLEPSTHTSRAYYVGGACVARPYLGPDSLLPFAKLSPQRAYSQRLLILLHSRRKFLRTLRGKASASSPNATSIRPYSLPTWFTAAYETFRSTLLKSNPSPTRLAFTDKEDILILIKCCTGLLRKRRNIDGGLSVWIWALLARLDDVGELTNPEVSVVRELGKKAARTMESHGESRGLMISGASDESGSQLNSEVQPTALNENENENAETTHEVKEVDELEARKARLLALMESDSLSAPVEHAKDDDDDDVASKPSMEAHMESTEARNTHATLDMIILVVGEMFGQRDLLEHREALWR